MVALWHPEAMTRPRGFEKSLRIHEAGGIVRQVRLDAWKNELRSMKHCDFKALSLLFIFSAFLLPADASQDKPDPIQKPEEEYKVVCTYKMVRIDVEVRDSQGNEVKDLTKDNFTIYEDGEKQILC